MSRKRTAESDNLGANLRRIRTERGLTQPELAERAGSSDSTISRVERGRFDPSAALLQRLADGLGVTINDLLTSKPASKPAKQRPSVARLVALTDGLTDAQVDDLTKALKLVLAVGRRRASAR